VFERLSWNGTQQTFKATLTQAETGAPIGARPSLFMKAATAELPMSRKARRRRVHLPRPIPGSLQDMDHDRRRSPGLRLVQRGHFHAPQATDPAAVIYISYPPVVFAPPVLPSTCKGYRIMRPYLRLRTRPGNGGPYHFELGTMGGFPPMGIILSPDGTLSGTPTGTTSKLRYARSIRPAIVLHANFDNRAIRLQPCPDRHMGRNIFSGLQYNYL
jgi:hypothetical protein